MLMYAIPGFLLMKSKAIPENTPSAMSKVLLFACQPFFPIFAFNEVQFSKNLLAQIAVFIVFTVAIQLFIILLMSRIYKKRWLEVRFRIATIASSFGNCVFFGAPVLMALLPDFPEAVVFANAYAVGMNILGWTVGSSVITNDKKYISAKKVFLNPGTIGFIVAITLYVLDIKFTGSILNSIELLAKMTTPISMMVLGMRLATVKTKPIFTTPLFYLTLVIKQILLPVVALVVASIIPGFSKELIATTFILFACPIASIVLNFAEMLGDGQEYAADLFLLGTLSSAVTMPLVLLLI